MAPAERSRNEIVLHRQQADDRLNGTGGGSGVSGVRFGARHIGQMIPEHPFERGTFRGVVVRRPRAVRIDILNVSRLQTSLAQGLGHRQKGALPFLGGRGLVERVATVGIAADVGQRIRGILFQHDKSRTFSQVQTGPRFIEGTATLPVQNHQGIEAIQVVTAQRFGTAGDHQVHFIVLEHFGSQHHRIQGRGAGRADGTAPGIPQTGILRDFFRAPAAFVAVGQVLEFRLRLHPLEILLGHIHHTHGRPGNQGHPLLRDIANASLLQRLPYGQRPHQGCPTERAFAFQPQHLFHLLGGQFDFSHRNIRMDGTQVAHRPDA